MPPVASEFRILTGSGPAAIAVLQISGPAVAEFTGRHIRLHRPAGEGPWRRGRILRADLLDDNGEPLDDILVSVHADPPAWRVRLHLHGSPVLVGACAQLLRAAGFTERYEAPMLWQAANALEAEAWDLMARMPTLAGAQWLCRQVHLFDQAIRRILEETDLHSCQRRCRELLARRHVAQWLQTSARIAVTGPPNAGKSTLINTLSDERISLVSERPGTTRDWVEAPGQIHGFPVVWIDTAGLRDAASDAIEATGMARTRRLIRTCAACVVLLDARQQHEAMVARRSFLKRHARLAPACVALNKADLGINAHAVREELPPAWSARTISISARTGAGLESLLAAVLRGTGCDPDVLDQPAPFTPRHVQALESAAEASSIDRLRTTLTPLLEAAQRANRA